MYATTEESKNILAGELIDALVLTQKLIDGLDDGYSPKLKDNLIFK